MRVWTVQPLFVYEQLKKGISFRCDFQKSPFNDTEEFYTAYKWMASQMRKRIGMPPEGVEYPIWAWHTRNWKHKKPDLRSSDVRNYRQPYVCIELEIPDEEVLLSDFDAWHIILNNQYMSNAISEVEYYQDMNCYDDLNEVEKKKEKYNSWEYVFDVFPYENEWVTKGEYIQATFWEIKPEYIVDVRYIKARKSK